MSPASCLLQAVSLFTGFIRSVSLLCSWFCGLRVGHLLELELCVLTSDLLNTQCFEFSVYCLLITHTHTHIQSQLNISSEYIKNIVLDDRIFTQWFLMALLVLF